MDRVIPEGPPPVRASLYVVNMDGTGLVKVADRMVYPFNVTWSPDRRRLAFIQPSAQADQLMIVESDGSGLKGLSPQAGHAELFSFSPDGRQLVYGYLSADGKIHQLHVINAAGGPSRLVYDSGNGPIQMPVHPIWTRGNQILFVEAATEDPSQYDISKLYRIDPNGKNLVELAGNMRTVIGPSADGKQVALVAMLGEGEQRHTEIQLLNLDGTVARQVTNLGYYFDSAYGSPDGKYFNFFAYSNYMMEPPSRDLVVSLEGTVQMEIKDLGDYPTIVWRP